MGFLVEIQVKAIKQLQSNKLLIYAFILYFLIVLVAAIWQFPAKPPPSIIIIVNSTNAIALGITGTSPQEIISSPIQALFLAIPMIVIGFLVGWYALKAQKGNQAKLKTDAERHNLVMRIFFPDAEHYNLVMRIFFLYIIIVTGLYLTKSILKVATVLFSIPVGILIVSEIAIYAMTISILFWKPLLAAFRNKNMDMQMFNYTGMIISVLIAVAIGTEFSLLAAFVFLTAFSIYDLIAVFGTKHMQAMVKLLIAPTKREKIIKEGERAFVYPAFIYTGASFSEITELKCKNCRMPGFMVKEDGTEICKYCGREVKENPKAAGGYDVIYAGNDAKKLLETNEAYKAEYKKLSGARLLGGGDILLPGILIASAAFNVSFILGITLAIGAGVGMVGNLLIINKYRIGLPALPLIFISQILFYILAIIV